MHSPSLRPSLIERCRGLPCMPWPFWPLQRLQQLQVVLVPVLPLVGQQLGWLQQQRRREW